MPKNNSRSAQSAWKILRIATFGVWKRRMMMELRLFPKFLRTLQGNKATTTTRNTLYYFEREFSFDETPMFNVKMLCPVSIRFLIPCLATPQDDFDYDLHYQKHSAYDYENYNFKGDDQQEEEEKVSKEEEGIDLRAEEYIKNFYMEMKLQRQISYLQYKATQISS
jgi:hypothetical protein